MFKIIKKLNFVLLLSCLSIFSTNIILAEPGDGDTISSSSSHSKSLNKSEKSSDSGSSIALRPRSGNCLGEFGIFSVQDEREYQEDRTHIIDVPGAAFNYYGIYDGHGGSDCTDFLKNILGRVVLRRIVSSQRDLDVQNSTYNQNLQLDVGAVIRQTFFNINDGYRKVLQDDPSKNQTAGSCAISAIYDKNTKILYVANVGDSRAILVNKDGSFVELSHDFKASSLTNEERERIKEVGGRVCSSAGKRCKHHHCDIPRLGHRLAITRAFGDFCVKGVTAEPEIITVSSHELDKAAFLVMACDGVWDAVNNEAVAYFITSEDVKNRSPQNIAEILVHFAKLSPLSDRDNYTGPQHQGDNTTVIVVKLGA